MQQLQFQEMLDDIDSLKESRRKGLEKTNHFKPDEIELLLRITYELTDKDFEYFVAYILKNEGFVNIDVQGGYDDGGADIVAEKYGKNMMIQCKQWASPYITMKRAGEFYGTIYPLKKKNPESIIAYVTTSYMEDDVLDFFHIHGIDGTISNGKLLESCRELGLLTEEGWEKMIQYIEQQRILKLRKDLQSSFPIESELRKLQNQRILELRNHLPPSKQKRYIDFSTITYSTRFFQHWNLV